MRRRVWAMFASACFACAAPPSIETAGLTHAELPPVSAAERERLRRFAPDFLARAERARARVRSAGTPEAARDHAEVAALSWQAAQLEAECVELQRRRMAEDLRWDAALRALAVARYTALERRTHTTLARAAPELRSAEPSVQLTQRARLQLAAARVLGAEPAALEEAERRVRAAEQRPEQARAALELVEQVLARTRAREDAADPEPAVQPTEAPR